MDTAARRIQVKVLIACADPEIGDIWAHSLRQRGFGAILAESPEEAYNRWAQEIPELVVIDMGADESDSIALCRRLRSESVTPLLLFSSWIDEAHILEAYQAGADECVPKPISPALFLAKVNAWLRRTWTVPAEALDSLQVGDLRLNPPLRQVETPSGETIRLTNLEFRLLHLLMSHSGWALETNLLVERVWGYCGNGDNTLLKNVIYRLRRKIEADPGNPQYILTEAGVGYKFQATAS